MASGIISYNGIPGWPTPAAGLFEACENALLAAGFPATVSRRPDGVFVSDLATANGVIAAYVGGSTELSYNKAQKQIALDVLFDSNFDLAAFIRGGTSTAITATNVGNFLATITNNYRSLRAQIANAPTLAILNAVNVNSGWPSNP